MPTTHLIAGLPCSGKTTYGIELRAATGGVLFTLDRWLITSFGRYNIAEVGHMEHGRRVIATRELIWETATEFLKRDVDVILDDGFFLRHDRKRYVELAGRLGAPTRIHHVDAPVDVLRARIESRNASLPQYNFWISPDAMQVFVAMFQRPTAEEGGEIHIVRDFTPQLDRPGAL